MALKCFKWLSDYLVHVYQKFNMVATGHNLKIELLENVCFFSETFEVI
jgi:hypothetical protein